MWKNWGTTILGAWLVLSGLVGTLQSPLNLFVVGILAAFLGFARSITRLQRANGVLGIWLVISAFFPVTTGPANFLVAGLLMAILGVLGVRRRAAIMLHEREA
ncbi:hypothetical protein GF314_14910 [bacterium]|nr:hypothetical protein [bacterium]